jgi:hypothetical protein
VSESVYGRKGHWLDTERWTIYPISTNVLRDPAAWHTPTEQQFDPGWKELHIANVELQNGETLYGSHHNLSGIVEFTTDLSPQHSR